MEKTSRTRSSKAATVKEGQKDPGSCPTCRSKDTGYDSRGVPTCNQCGCQWSL